MKTLFASLFICSLVLIDARAAGLAVDHSGNLFFAAGANNENKIVTSWRRT